MKALITIFFGTILFSCNSNDSKTAGKDSTITLNVRVDSLNLVATSDTAREEYCYIEAIEKVKDSVFIKADYVQYFTGKNVVEEAKKRHRADTSFDKNGKIEDIFVPDDYFIVNDNKTLRSLYLAPETPIKMESEFVTDKTKEINNYNYFSTHFKNSLFALSVKGKKVESIKEIFLP